MRRSYFRTVLTALSFVALAWVTVSAVEVMHHGEIIESEVTAATCLTCHDGAASTKIAAIVCAPVCTDAPHTGPYPARKEGYATLQAVQAAGLKLENGKITCITCHDLNNPDEYQLALNKDPHGQELCFVCHVGIAARMRQLQSR